MTNVTGAWDIVTATPIGKQALSLELVVQGSAVSGTARNDAEFVELRNGEITGDTATFAIDLKKPFPLTVAYTLHFDSDTLTGTAKAGFFPTSSVVGKRVSSVSGDS